MLNPMSLYRIGRWVHLHRIPAIPRIIYYVIYVIFNCSLPMSAEIGPGTRLAYGGLGVVIHYRCRIGRNVVVAPHVTIGGRSGRKDVPVIEDDCYLGVGARILGPVRIGAGSIVGANAVVIDDVPARSIVAGVPGKVIRTGIDLREYV